MVTAPSPTRKHFRKEGVIVKFPGQARPVQAQRLALPGMASMPAVAGGFQPFRLVINLKLVDVAQPHREVLEFDPPIEVRVRYTASDLELAKAAGRPLCLGFWDGKQWIRFIPEKHQFHLETGASPEAGGLAVVKLSHWGDPPIAVGT